MAIPSSKSPDVDGLISRLMGRDRRATIEANKCMTCDGDANGFRDALSAKEYTISGMCQACQDKTFGDPEANLEDMFNQPTEGPGYKGGGHEGYLGPDKGSPKKGGGIG